MTTGLIAFYSQFFTCPSPHVDQCSDPLLGTPVVPLESSCSADAPTAVMIIITRMMIMILITMIMMTVIVVIIMIMITFIIIIQLTMTYITYIMIS